MPLPKFLVFSLFYEVALYVISYCLLVQVFMSATPADYWCRIPVDNITKDDLNDLLPKEDRNGVRVNSRCRMFDINYSDSLTRKDIFELINSSKITATVPCQHGWEYDHSVYESTTVTDWDLVCENEIYATLSFASATFGGLFGAFLWAFIADRFGRKLSYFSMVGFQIVSGRKYVGLYHFKSFRNSDCPLSPLPNDIQGIYGSYRTPRIVFPALYSVSVVGLQTSFNLPMF